MTIQEAQEQIKNTSFVENTDIFCKQSFRDRADTFALFTIIEALQNGYQLCNVGEAIENIKSCSKTLGTRYFNAEQNVISTQDAIDIVKEACK